MSSREERDLIWSRVDEALCLIKEHSPVRAKQVSGDLSGILVAGLPSVLGRFITSLRLCDLSFEFCSSATTTAADIAAVIVHEAQHARLSRLGISLDRMSQHRIERVCYRAQRAISRRIPGGGKFEAIADQMMNAEPSHYAPDKILLRQIGHVRRLPAPGWFKELIVASMKRRAKPQDAQ